MQRLTMSDILDDEESRSSEFSEEEMSWISANLMKKGADFFCEVDEDFIEDAFNLYGLRQYFNRYSEALSVILGPVEGVDPVLQAQAKELYGLIHARFILTSRGLQLMREKYLECDFGICPRALCNSQPVLPVGLQDEPGRARVCVFCPACEEAYSPTTVKSQQDGAYFGTTFPHLFFKTFPELCPKRSNYRRYVPRIFGFRIYNPRRAEESTKKQAKPRDIKELASNADAQASSSSQVVQDSASRDKLDSQIEVSSNKRKRLEELS